MKDRQIKSIKQHVAFRFFGSDLTVEALKHKVTMTFHPMGVHVLSTKGEDVVVPYSNITHIELQPEASKPEPKSEPLVTAEPISIEEMPVEQPKPKAKKKVRE